MNKTLLVTCGIFFFFLHAINAQFDSIALPNELALKNWTGFNGSVRNSLQSDSIVSEWQNGMLHGAYTSYYADGSIRSRGNFENNHRVGKWVLFDASGKNKLVLDFNKYGYVLLRRARIRGKGGVWLGRGKIYNHLPYHSEFGYSSENKGHITGMVRFRQGLKNGDQIEYYSNGNRRSESKFKNGLYDGNRKVFYETGTTALEMTYSNGTPIGQRKEYHPDGTLASAKESNAASASFVLDKQDVFMASYHLLYTDTLLTGTAPIFRPDSGKAFFEVLNDAFNAGQLSAYNDDQLKEVYFPFHDRPDISGLNKEMGSWKNLRGVLIKTYEIFNTQTWLTYRFPVSISPVWSISKSDSLLFGNGPWLYFPQMRNEIADGAYPFSFFKSYGYAFLTVSSMASQPWMMDFSDRNAVCNEQLRSVESEHDLWLVFYGLRSDGIIQ